ncbi:sulfotransferase family protein [Lyngbya confervoides]|uniref:Sulfotransferase n=1 Tax=Lyngbya confervoides BDU141951 TaxID=1574623 RepID=A0ABD4T996_9CYAN|nr:sulfotransferase [Lyngbya confervoides]MCM1984897.1 sulfotransferase [Lyngbya confervoides BDU141951]
MTSNGSAEKDNLFGSLPGQEKDTTKIKDPVLFIVSSGRSATTLLRSILNASNQIAIPHESDFIGRAYRFYQKKSEFIPQDYENIVSLFMVTSRGQGWGLDKDYLISYLNRYQPQSFADINRVFYQAYHEREGTEDLLWGIKSPVLIASLEEILTVFPDTQIIHVVRDGRDVYLSYKKVHQKSQVKFGPKRLLPAILYWVDGLRRVEKLKNGEQKVQVYELRYKDLIRFPDEELSKLCDCVGIEYFPKMYQDYHNLERNQKLVSPKFMTSFHSKAKQGLDPNNAEKFYREMRKRERFFFELLAAPYLQKYNYPIEFKFLLLPVWNILRYPLYFVSKLFNDWRYRERDFKSLKWANIN